VVVLFDWHDKDSSIADLAGTCSSDHRLDDVVDAVVISDNLDHDLWQQTHFIFQPAIDRVMSLLTTVAFGFRYRHSGCNSLECFDEFIELVGLDDTLN